MKKLILKYFGDFIAKVYISIVKPSIDNYYTMTQLSNASVGYNTKFYGRGVIFYSENFSIGNDSRIGYGYFFHSKGGISIGNNTILSRNVTIYSANHNYLSQQLIPYDETHIEKKVTIGDSVWIGMNVSILPGVTIGEGAIIGMGAIITKDIGKGEIVVGMKQRVVSQRNLEVYENLKNKKKFYGRYDI